MRASLCTLAVLSALTMLTACQKEPEPAPAAPAQPQAQPQTQQEASKPNPASSSPALVQEPAVPQQDPAVQAIESKPFGEGTLALTKAKVVGQILNVEFIFTPPKKPNGEKILLISMKPPASASACCRTKTANTWLTLSVAQGVILDSRELLLKLSPSNSLPQPKLRRPSLSISPAQARLTQFR